MDEKITKLDVGNNIREFKIKAIWNKTVYIKKSILDHLLKFYCKKNYLEKKILKS